MRTKLNSLLLLVCVGLFSLWGCSRGPQTARYLQRGEAQFKLGDYDRAEIEYLNVLQLEPTNYVALRQLGLMAYEQNRLSRAHAMLSSAKSLKSDDLEVRLKLAIILNSAGSPNLAREEAAAILSLQPTNHEAMQLIVESSRNTNELNEAEQRLRKLQSAGEPIPGYHIAQAALHLRHRDRIAAEASIRKALALDPKSSAAHAALGSLNAVNKDVTNALVELAQAAELAPLRSPYRIRYVDFLLSTGDTAAARDQLELISKKAPDYLPALLRLAEIALSERRFADCEGALKSILARDPSYLEAMMTLARLRIAQSRPEQAIAELENALKYFPRLPLAHYQMGVAYLLQNDLPNAAKSLNDALSLAPDYPDATLLLAELNLRRGNASLAVNSLAKLAEQRPGFLPAQYLLANAYRAVNKLDLAQGIYEKLSRLSPTNPQPPFLMGVVQLQQERKAQARQSFEHALKLSPDFTSAVEQLLNLDLVEKNFAGARDRVQKEIERAPTNAFPYVLQARVHLAESNTAAAEAALLKAVEVAPESGAANSLLARILVATKRQEAALQRLQTVVARNTNDYAAWMMIAELHNAASNYVAVGKAYDAILAANPRHVPALNNLAWLCSEKLNDPKRAYELVNRARDLNPRDPFTADTFGWVIYHLGDYPRALALFQESARALPAQPEVQYHLGMAHYLMGEEAAARVALQSAVQLADGDAVWKPEALERLRLLDVNPSAADAAALKSLEEMSSRAPRDPILLARLAAVSAQQGKPEKAAELYEKALQLNSNLVPAMVSLAQLYSTGIKNPDRAFTLARRARSLESDDPGIAHLLGALAFEAARQPADFRWAYSLLQESARTLRDDPEVLFDLGRASYSLGDVSNAVVCMEQVASAKPASPRAAEATRFTAMNRLANGLGDPAATSAQVAALLKQQPDYVPALFANGAFLERQQDFNGARKAYEQILQIYPAFVPATKKLAVLCFQHLNDSPKAYTYATRAREAYPADPEVARLLGSLEYERGEYARAALLLKESANVFPNDADLFYRLGQAQFKLKQSGECRESLQRALSLMPTSPQAPAARRILEELK